MSEPRTRRDALAVLGLPPDADEAAVKRAYRRRARDLHPDAGGDPDAFRELQDAYEQLRTSGAAASTRREPPRARPSRRTRAGEAPTRRWSEQEVDVDDVDWEARTGGEGLVPLDLDVVARALVREHVGPVHPLVARSRGPRSVLNRWLHLVADDLTATLVVRPAHVRGRRGHDVEVWLRVWARGARRLVDGATLPEDWVRQRGSSTTTLIRTITPSADRRVTAVRTARILEDGLEAAGWPLGSWYAPADELR